MKDITDNNKSTILYLVICGLVVFVYWIIWIPRSPQVQGLDSSSATDNYSDQSNLPIIPPLPPNPLGIPPKNSINLGLRLRPLRTTNQLRHDGPHALDPSIGPQEAL